MQRRNAFCEPLTRGVGDGFELDALSWVNTNALEHFGDEFRIQLAWMRQSPPNIPTPGPAFRQGRAEDENSVG